MNGMPCETKNVKPVLLYLMLSSKVADISDMEVLLGLNRGSRTPDFFDLCTAQRNTFAFSAKAEVGTLSSTKRNAEEHRNA